MPIITSEDLAGKSWLWLVDEIAHLKETMALGIKPPLHRDVIYLELLKAELATRAEEP